MQRCKNSPQGSCSKVFCYFFLFSQKLQFHFLDVSVYTLGLRRFWKKCKDAPSPPPPSPEYKDRKSSKLFFLGNAQCQITETQHSSVGCIGKYMSGLFDMFVTSSPASIRKFLMTHRDWGYLHKYCLSNVKAAIIWNCESTSEPDTVSV